MSLVLIFTYKKSAKFYLNLGFYTTLSVVDIQDLLSNSWSKVKIRYKCKIPLKWSLILNSESTRCIQYLVCIQLCLASELSSLSNQVVCRACPVSFLKHWPVNTVITSVKKAIWLISVAYTSYALVGPYYYHSLLFFYLLGVIIRSLWNILWPCRG